MKFTLLSTVLLFIIHHCCAQDAAQVCSKGKIDGMQQIAMVTVASAEEDKYDVTHVKFDIALDNQSVDISGNVTTTAKVLEPNFAVYAFELNQLLTIDSVIINGQNVRFYHNSNLAEALCPEPYQPGQYFTAQVFYHGTPEEGNVAPFKSGMNHAPATPWNTRVTYTLSQPYNAKDWWPCKQSLKDKIDSVDIWITVPDSLKAGSNGVLQRITTLPGNKARYEWRTHYPVAYYLISVAVGAYQEYTINTVLPDGLVVPIQNYIYDRPGAVENFRRGIDSCAIMMNYFSELFGRYPFYKEKYGHSLAPLFGGMEHQTMTTQQHFGTRLTAHELAHQWFGNAVTCAGWQDIWMNEGFASYSEYLWAEKYWGVSGAYNFMQSIHRLYLNDTNATGSIYIAPADTQNAYVVFNNSLTYNKASAVLHTLRYAIDNDEVFFRILKTLVQRFNMGNAGTTDFKQLVAEITGRNWDSFFDQWIYGRGYPKYTAVWNQAGENVWIDFSQQASQAAHTPFFNLPVEIALSSAQGDTVIKFENVTPKQSLHIKTSRKITGLTIDPRNMILNTDAVIHNGDMGQNITVYPNPTNNLWKISNLVQGMELLLTDIKGKTVWQSTATGMQEVTIDATNYARGMYILRVTDVNGATKKIKLTRL